MANTQRIESEELREYIYQFVPEKLEENETFVKCYGKQFAEKRLKNNLLVVYVEPSYVTGKGGYQNGIEKIIVIGNNDEKRETITSNDIEKDEILQDTALHESIHAIFTKSPQECEALNLNYCTGIQISYFDPYGIYIEIGRGLDEGWVVWLCQKCGYDSQAYKELTDIVNLLEIAVGTENVMQLGKGDTYNYNKFPKLLNMTRNEVNKLLSSCDIIYKQNEKIDNYKDVYEYIGLSDKLKEKNSQKYEREKKLLEQYKKSQDFIEFKNKNENLSEEAVLRKFLKDKIESCRETKEVSLIEVESLIINKYFMKDFEKKDISDEKFKKIMKALVLLKSPVTNIPEVFGGFESASVVMRKKEKDFVKRYIEKASKRKAIAFQQGELSVNELNETIESLIKEEYKQEFIKQFSSNINKDLENELIRVFNVIKRTDKMQNLENFTLYKLKSKDENKNLTSIITKSSENYAGHYIGYYYDDHGMIITSEDSNPSRFDFTRGEREDEYEVTMQNFLKLREEVFEKNINAKIIILNREVVVKDNDEERFYYIDDGEFVPMEIERQMDLQFKPKEKVKQNSENPLVKVGFWAKFVNKVKRIIHNFKNKKKNDGSVVFEDSKSENNTSSNSALSSRYDEDKFASYIINDFDRRLEEKQKNSDLNITQSNEKEHDRD